MRHQSNGEQCPDCYNPHRPGGHPSEGVWRHGTSWDDLRGALAKGLPVVDLDNDDITEIGESNGGSVSLRYSSDEERGYEYRSDMPHYCLIQEPVVSEDEVQEAIDSIRRALT